MVIASETGSLGAGTSSPESRANTPPIVTVLGDEIRTAKVGEPIILKTSVNDDGIPTSCPRARTARWNSVIIDTCFKNNRFANFSGSDFIP